MFDDQRVQFASMASQQAVNYFQNHRDVTRATMETNMQQQAEKAEREARLKAEERALDKHELHVATSTRKAYVADHDMNRYTQ